MNFLLENAIFGELRIEETFLYIDGPRLFLASNIVGTRYIVNCLDIDEDEERWILTAVSERRLGALKDGVLQLRDAFTHPEMSHVYYISTSPAGELLDSKETEPSSLTDDVLPMVDSFLPAIPEAQPLVTAPFLARSLNASVVLLRLFPKTTKHEAPAKAVGDILSSFAVYINAKLRNAYKDLTSALTQTGNALIPQTDVVGAFAGSLGVEFAVRGDEVRVMAALKSAMADLASVSNLDELYERMTETESTELASLKIFLYRLSAAKSDLMIEAASVSSESAIEAQVSLKTVRRGVRRLRLSKGGEPTFQTVEVELVGMNSRSKTFEARVLASDLTIKGTVSADVFRDAKAEVPSPYRLVIETGPPLMGRPGIAKLISATRLS